MKIYERVLGEGVIEGVKDLARASVKALGVVATMGVGPVAEAVATMSDRQQEDVDSNR